MRKAGNGGDEGVLQDNDNKNDSHGGHKKGT